MKAQQDFTMKQEAEGTDKLVKGDTEEVNTTEQRQN